MPGWALASSDGGPLPVPPPIPTSGLLLDLASENYAITDLGGGFAQGDWTDDSGNGNDVSTASTLLIHVPTIEPGAFNADPGVTFSRVNSFALDSALGPTWYAANAPRSMAMVIRGDSISPGSLFNVRTTSTNHHTYQLSGAALPQLIWLNNPSGDIANTNPFFDLNGNKAILFWDTDGAIGDPLRFWVNNVAATPDATMLVEGAVVNFIEVGFDGGGPGGLRADASYARVLTWNRVLTDSERAAVFANLTSRYLWSRGQ